MRKRSLRFVILLIVFLLSLTIVSASESCPATLDYTSVETYQPDYIACLDPSNEEFTYGNIPAETYESPELYELELNNDLLNYEKTDLTKIPANEVDYEKFFFDNNCPQCTLILKEHLLPTPNTNGWDVLTINPSDLKVTGKNSISILNHEFKKKDVKKLGKRFDKIYIYKTIYQDDEYLTLKLYAKNDTEGLEDVPLEDIIIVQEVNTSQFNDYYKTALPKAGVISTAILQQGERRDEKYFFIPQKQGTTPNKPHITIYAAGIIESSTGITIQCQEECDKLPVDELKLTAEENILFYPEYELIINQPFNIIITEEPDWKELKPNKLIFEFKKEVNLKRNSQLYITNSKVNLLTMTTQLFFGQAASIEYNPNTYSIKHKNTEFDVSIVQTNNFILFNDTEQKSMLGAEYSDRQKLLLQITESILQSKKTNLENSKNKVKELEEDLLKARNGENPGYNGALEDIITYLEKEKNRYLQAISTILEDIKKVENSIEELKTTDLDLPDTWTTRVCIGNDLNSNPEDLMFYYELGSEPDAAAIIEKYKSTWQKDPNFIDESLTDLDCILIDLTDVHLELEGSYARINYELLRHGLTSLSLPYFDLKSKINLYNQLKFLPDNIALMINNIQITDVAKEGLTVSGQSHTYTTEPELIGTVTAYGDIILTTTFLFTHYQKPTLVHEATHLYTAFLDSTDSIDEQYEFPFVNLEDVWIFYKPGGDRWDRTIDLKINLLNKVYSLVKNYGSPGKTYNKIWAKSKRQRMERFENPFYAFAENYGKANYHEDISTIMELVYLASFGKENLISNEENLPGIKERTDPLSEDYTPELEMKFDYLARMGFFTKEMGNKMFKNSRNWKPYTELVPSNATMYPYGFEPKEIDYVYSTNTIEAQEHIKTIIIQKLLEKNYRQIIVSGYEYYNSWYELDVNDPEVVNFLFGLAVAEIEYNFNLNNKVSIMTLDEIKSKLEVIIDDRIELESEITRMVKEGEQIIEGFEQIQYEELVNLLEENKINEAYQIILETTGLKDQLNKIDTIEEKIMTIRIKYDHLAEKQKNFIEETGIEDPEIIKQMNVLVEEKEILVEELEKLLEFKNTQIPVFEGVNDINLYSFQEILWTLENMNKQLKATQGPEFTFKPTLSKTVTYDETKYTIKMPGIKSTKNYEEVIDHLIETGVIKRKSDFIDPEKGLIAKIPIWYLDLNIIQPDSNNPLEFTFSRRIELKNNLKKDLIQEYDDKLFRDYGDSTEAIVEFGNVYKAQQLAGADDRLKDLTPEEIQALSKGWNSQKTFGEELVASIKEATIIFEHGLEQDVIQNGLTAVKDIQDEKVIILEIGGEKSWEEEFNEVVGIRRYGLGSYIREKTPVEDYLKDKQEALEIYTLSKYLLENKQGINSNIVKVVKGFESKTNKQIVTEENIPVNVYKDETTTKVFMSYYKYGDRLIEYKDMEKITSFVDTDQSGTISNWDLYIIHQPKNQIIQTHADRDKVKEGNESHLYSEYFDSYDNLVYLFLEGNIYQLGRVYFYSSPFEKQNALLHNIISSGSDDGWGVLVIDEETGEQKRVWISGENIGDDELTKAFEKALVSNVNSMISGNAEDMEALKEMIYRTYWGDNDNKIARAARNNEEVVYEYVGETIEQNMIDATFEQLGIEKPEIEPEEPPFDPEANRNGGSLPGIINSPDN